MTRFRPITRIMKSHVVTSISPVYLHLSIYLRVRVHRHELTTFRKVQNPSVQSIGSVCCVAWVVCGVVPVHAVQAGGRRLGRRGAAAGGAGVRAQRRRRGGRGRCAGQWRAARAADARTAVSSRSPPCPARAYPAPPDSMAHPTATITRSHALTTVRISERILRNVTPKPAA